MSDDCMHIERSLMYKHFKPKCIRCERIVEPIETFPEPILLTDSVLDLNWEGSVIELQTGYGSTYDGDKFVIAVCDKCLEEGYEKDLVRRSPELFREHRSPTRMLRRLIAELGDEHLLPLLTHSNETIREVVKEWLERRQR